MDDTDQSLLAALRRDGRASISELSLELGLARATVRSRLEKLKSEGEILGFTVVLKGDAREQQVRGIILVAVEGRGTDRIVNQLGRLPEVQTVHTTNGRWDLIAELGTESLEALDSVLRRIRLIDGIAASETNLYLATKRMSNAGPKAPSPSVPP